MKTLISVLVVLAFIQTSIVSIDLILLVLVSRAYVVPGRANYYLAFGLGIFAGQLNLTTLGILSMFYLIAVAATEALSKFRLAGNPLAIVPVIFALVLLKQPILNQPIELTEAIFSSIFALPVLYALRLWEERFIVHKDIKLKFKRT